MAEIGAFEVGNFALFCCPVGHGQHLPPAAVQVEVPAAGADAREGPRGLGHVEDVALLVVLPELLARRLRGGPRGPRAEKTRAARTIQAPAWGLTMVA